MVVVDTPMKDAFFITTFSGGLDRSVSCGQGRHARQFIKVVRAW
jgi:hypothetical protein